MGLESASAGQQGELSQSDTIRGSEQTAGGQSKVLYPKKTQLDFEGAKIEGEIQNPGEFYFQHRPSEKFDSMVQRRKNFHREMMRDVVFTK
jgi:hypothetical protein